MSAPIRFDRLNIDEVEITTPKLNKKTNKIQAYVISKVTGKTLFVETPYLKVPFGLSILNPVNPKAPIDLESPDANGYVYSIPVQFGFSPSDEPSESDSEEIRDARMFHAFLRSLQDKMVDYGMTHYKTFYPKNKECTRDSFEENKCNLFLKSQTDKDGNLYSDRITLKLDGNEDNSGPKRMEDDEPMYVFFKNKSLVDIRNWSDLSSSLPRGGKIKFVFQAKFYFVNSRIGIKLVLKQMKLPEISRTRYDNKRYAFSDVNDEDENEDRTETTSSGDAGAAAAAPVSSTRRQIMDTHTQDSDNEIEAEAVDADE
jgi:hypothetical protein